MEYDSGQEGGTVMAEIRAAARITGKGQVQVPLSIRKAVGAEIGDDLLFAVTDDGRITVEVRKRTRLRDLGGVLRTERQFPGIEEEEAGVREAWVRRRQAGTEK